MTTQPPNKPKRRTYSAEFKELLVQEAESSPLWQDSCHP